MILKFSEGIEAYVIVKGKKNEIYLYIFFVINDTLVYKMFTSVSFIAILRHCNQAAHVLAAFAKEKVGVSVWFDECPPFLFPFV